MRNLESRGAYDVGLDSGAAGSTQPRGSAEVRLTERSYPSFPLKVEGQGRKGWKGRRGQNEKVSPPVRDLRWEPTQYG